jgi:alkylation response protein AidB-like acyl-CoA dehydrogenase
MSLLYERLVDVTEAMFDSVLSLCFKGPFRLAALFGARMRAAGGGVIINVRSTGSMRPPPEAIPYSGAKAALNAITEGLAVAFGPEGERLADKQAVQAMIADSYIEIQQFRLLVLYTAWQLDQFQDYQRVRKDIAAIKVQTPRVLESVARRAVQVHGALGTTYDLPLTHFLGHGPLLALADGPTEVHRGTVAKQVLRGYQPAPGMWPSE